MANYKLPNSYNHFRLSPTGHNIAFTPVVNAGSAFHIGSTSNVLDDVGIAPANRNRVFGSTVRDGGSSGPATEAVAAGTFATMTAGAYIMKRVTTTVAGVANTVLRSGALQPGRIRAIKYRATIRGTLTATAIRAGYWNIYTGRFTTGPSTSTDGMGDIGGNAASGGNDNAARPTADIPGELVYRQSGKPTGGTATGVGAKMDDYKPRTG